METIKLTRQELYNIVWSTPMTTLAKKYLISDSGLRKICKGMNIPTPKSGHWERLRAGKKSLKVKLPDKFFGSGDVSLTLRQEGDATRVGVNSELSILIGQIERDPNLVLEVPERLIQPDTLIKEIRRVSSDAIKGRILNNGLLVNRGEIKFAVSPKNVGRALRLMDTLIKAFRVRGHETKQSNGDLIFVINTIEFKVHLREKLKRIEVKSNSLWNSYDFELTDMFLLSIKAGYVDELTWQDGKFPIEKYLAKIIATVELRSLKILEENRLRAIRQAKQDEERRIEEEREEREENDRLAFKELLNEAKRWEEAKLLREYINQKEIRAIASNAITKGLKDWFVWARERTDLYDPTMKD